MSLRRAVYCLVSLGFLPILAAAQGQVPRDPQAMAVLSQAVAAMGATVPSDSVATGAISVVEGSRTEAGTVRLLSRGVDQSAEFITVPSGARAVIYSRGLAAERNADSTKSLQLELVVSSYAPDFPLLLLLGAVSDPSFAFQYVGLETVEGAAAHHIRFWKVFSSDPDLQHLTEFSAKQMWIDVTSGLPRKLAYIRRAAAGAEAGIPVEVSYSDYRNTGGVLYPFTIRKSFNGTAWATVTIQTLNLNAGLTDADFPVQ